MVSEAASRDMHLTLQARTWIIPRFSRTVLSPCLLATYDGASQSPPVSSTPRGGIRPLEMQGEDAIPAENHAIVLVQVYQSHKEQSRTCDDGLMGGNILPPLLDDEIYDSN
jgi:hypothetical protein